MRLDETEPEIPTTGVLDIETFKVIEDASRLTGNEPVEVTVTASGKVIPLTPTDPVTHRFEPEGAATSNEPVEVTKTCGWFDIDTASVAFPTVTVGVLLMETPRFPVEVIRTF